MSKHKFVVRLILAVAALSLGAGQAIAQVQPAEQSQQSERTATNLQNKSKRVTQAERQAAADRVKAALPTTVGRQQVGVQAVPNPLVKQGDVPDYFTKGS